MNEALLQTLCHEIPLVPGTHLSLPYQAGQSADTWPTLGHLTKGIGLVPFSQFRSMLLDLWSPWQCWREIMTIKLTLLKVCQPHTCIVLNLIIFFRLYKSQPTTFHRTGWGKVRESFKSFFSSSIVVYMFVGRRVWWQMFLYKKSFFLSKHTWLENFWRMDENNHTTPRYCNHS